LCLAFKVLTTCGLLSCCNSCGEAGQIIYGVAQLVKIELQSNICYDVPMKKRHAIAIVLLILYLIVCQIAGFMLLHICDNYVGEYALPVPKECQIYNAQGFTANLLILGTLTIPVILIAMYAKFGWPRDKK
jgi:hypothetical protein